MGVRMNAETFTRLEFFHTEMTNMFEPRNVTFNMPLDLSFVLVFFTTNRALPHLAATWIFISQNGLLYEIIQFYKNRNFTSFNICLSVNHDIHLNMIQIHDAIKQIIQVFLW